MKNIVNAEKIETYIKEKQMTKTNFCEECRISRTTLNNMLKGKNIGISVLRKVADTMGINILLLLKDE